MNAEEFEEIFETVIDRIRNTLVVKAREYANDGDRMRNFKLSSQILRGTPEQALLGFETKHLVSVIDMIESGEPYPEALWDEKIGDTLVYFLLLRALVVETGRCVPTVEGKRVAETQTD